LKWWRISLKRTTHPRHERLLRGLWGGMSEADARAHIAAVVAVETYAVMKSQDVFNRERFVRNLRALPEEPKL
jgi:hypothetical protein